MAVQNSNGSAVLLQSRPLTRRRLIVAWMLVAAIALVLLAVRGISFRHDLAPATISHDTGTAYIAPIKTPWLLEPEGDSGTDGTASPLRLFEDGHELGPAHISHAQIRRSGGGRFSHWGASLWFSTSDNSDPRSNGRTYSIGYDLRLPVPVGWTFAGGLLMASLAVLFPPARRPATIDDRPVRPRQAIMFTLVFAATWGAALLGYSFWWEARKPPPDQTALPTRLGAYLRDPAPYNLLFMGDSRTYCGIHPDFIDPLLGSRSVSLSQFAHWFPTQHSMVRDMVAAIPKGTVVVWSIGHQNLVPSTGISRAYPVGWGNALRYLSWGVPTKGLLGNLINFTPFLALFQNRADLRKSLLDQTEKPLPSPWGLIAGNAWAAWPPAPKIPLDMPQAEWPDALLRQYGDDPRVITVEPGNHKGKYNSAILRLKGGSYLRIEIDHAFFRAKQAETAPKPISEEAASRARAFPYNEGLLRLLDETLELYRQAGLRVIVNELEEAPHMYPHPLVRAQRRQFMREVVRPRVEAKGFAYIWTDLDTLNSEDYFDYNHMNSQGVAKYTPMLAKKLAETIQAKGWELH